MDDKERAKCRCEDCGKEFLKGDEGDNEKFCLRCEHLSLREREEDQDCDFEE